MQCALPDERRVLIELSGMFSFPLFFEWHLAKFAHQVRNVVQLLEPLCQIKQALQASLGEDLTCQCKEFLSSMR